MSDTRESDEFADLRANPLAGAVLRLAYAKCLDAARTLLNSDDRTPIEITDDAFRWYLQNAGYPRDIGELRQMFGFAESCTLSLEPFIASVEADIWAHDTEQPSEPPIRGRIIPITRQPPVPDAS
jgi:hypothetical protein